MTLKTPYEKTALNCAEDFGRYAKINLLIIISGRGNRRTLHIIARRALKIEGHIYRKEGIKK